MEVPALDSVAKKLMDPTKGILAADESTKTITKRFDSLGLVSTPELNKKYRELLFTTPEIENYISGVILYKESIDQELNKILEVKGILTGIKVDEGLESFNDSPEKVTKGLTTLDTRLKGFQNKGLTFTKWRGVFKITDLYPSDAFYEENLNRMVKFAKISQENGFLPIVEPEILLDGNHTTTRSSETLDKTLTILFDKLKKESINLSGLILKTSMALPGPESGVKALPLEVANATLRALNRSTPPEVGGIVFLSGGQTPDSATHNLNEIEKLKNEAPWPLSFSFSRALQDEAMKEWSGKDENRGKAQEIFLNRLKMVVSARKGEL